MDKQEKFFADMEDEQARDAYLAFVEDEAARYEQELEERQLKEWYEAQAWDAWQSLE